MKLLLASTSLFTLTAVAAFAGDPGPMIFGAAGTDAAAVRSAFTAFQNILGPLNAPGSAGDPNGRRELSWDGVPAQFSSPNNMPPDFFNKNSARGVVFGSDNSSWSAFQVSANEADGPVRFDTLLPGYSSIFQVFSSQKLFTSIGANDLNVDFFVPGTEVKGKVRGFGAIFANVALPFRTYMEFYNSDGMLLGRYFVPPSAGGLSFVGVVFPQRMVARVHIVPGNAVAGSNDDPANGRNVVMMDDFIYGEPVSECVN